MNRETYTYLLAHPQDITSKHLEALNKVIDSFPYFQSARALQLKGLKNEESFLYNDALKVAAAHTTDRDILFEYITSKTFEQHNISQAIIKHDASILDIDVAHEDLSATLSVELDDKIKSELEKAEAILNPELFERKVSSVIDLAENDSADKSNPEQTLELNKPLSFKKSDTHSFSEWLKLTRARPIERKDTAEETSDQKDKEKKFDLIDKFIQETPKLKPAEKTGKNINLAEPFIQSNEALMTETLAKVYVQQKNYEKAIQAYKILILKYPQKSGYFADQIRAIKKLTNKK